MKNFRAVMNVTTERHVDNTAKKDVTLAEVGLTPACWLPSDMFTAESDVEPGT